MFRRPKPTIWSCLTVSVHHREKSSVRSQEGLIVLQQFHLKKNYRVDYWNWQTSLSSGHYLNVTMIIKIFEIVS